MQVMVFTMTKLSKNHGFGIVWVKNCGFGIVWVRQFYIACRWNFSMVVYSSGWFCMQACVNFSNLECDAVDIMKLISF